MNSIRALALAILMSVPALDSAGYAADCNVSDAQVYTLYRDSPVEPGMRLHVATFDADDHEDYNIGVCRVVRDFYLEQPYLGANYWCEAGRYREFSVKPYPRVE